MVWRLATRSTRGQTHPSTLRHRRRQSGRVTGIEPDHHRHIRRSELASGQSEPPEQPGLVLQWEDPLRHRVTGDLGRQAVNDHHGPEPSPSGLLALQRTLFLTFPTNGVQRPVPAHHVHGVSHHDGTADDLIRARPKTPLHYPGLSIQTEGPAVFGPQ